MAHFSTSINNPKAMIADVVDLVDLSYLVRNIKIGIEKMVASR